MKGAIFTGFADFVEQQYGLTHWLKSVERAQLETNGEYISTELYDDQDFMQLLSATSSVTQASEEHLLRSFGASFFNVLYQIAKKHVIDIDNLFDFLIAVDQVIHIEVKKADPLAYTPSLFYDQPSTESLIIRYVSKRKLCFFAEGLILGAAKHFNQTINIDQIACMHQGDKHCLIKVDILS